MSTLIPEAPEMDFTLEQTAIFSSSAEIILDWIDFLKSLGFAADAVHTYIVPDDRDNEDYYFLSNYVEMDYSPVTAVEKNLLFFGAGFANIYQFLEDSAWPDTFGDDSNQPIFLQAAFFTEDRAIISMGGWDGIPLFNNEKYGITEEGLTMTWNEAAEMLIAISAEMSEKLKLQQPPHIRWWRKFTKFVLKALGQ